MTDFLNPKIHAAQQLIEDLTDQEKIFLLQAAFPFVEVDGQGQYVVYTEINDLSHVFDDSDDLSDHLDVDDDEEILEYLKSDVSSRYKTFVHDMVRVGFKYQLRLKYNGRFGYSGPGCDTSRSENISTEDIIRATKLSVQTDNMGMGHIVYLS